MIRVQLPGATRDFSPLSQPNVTVGLPDYGVYKYNPCMQPRALTSVCILKIPGTGRHAHQSLFGHTTIWHTPAQPSKMECGCPSGRGIKTGHRHNLPPRKPGAEEDQEQICKWTALLSELSQGI